MVTRRQAGFTILETLIATAISTIVLLVLLSAYHGFVRALEVAGRESKSPAVALDEVAQLLISGVADGMLTNEPAFGLDYDVHSNAVLVFYRAAITAKPPETVLSRVIVESQDGQLKVRQTPILPDRTQGEESTNVVLTGASSFAARAYYREEDFMTWPTSNYPPWPEAVDLELKVDGQTNIWSMETIIPVGWQR